MNQFFRKKLFLISFILIPIFFLWHPDWIGILGMQPYWPLFWLLPWSLIYGPINGLILGLFLALVLDAISPIGSSTQIPGLVLCGFWFGRIRQSPVNIMVRHFRYGLICSIGSFICGTSYFLQILIKNLLENNILLFQPNLMNIFAQVFLTGLFAPLFCSSLLKILKVSKEKYIN